MLIFNGKKYFVPFISKEKIEGADATPEQVEEGVKFAGANGVVEEGRLPTYDGSEVEGYIDDVTDGKIFIMSEIGRAIVDDNVCTVIPFSEFGNAEAEDVVQGKTFTSAIGYKSTGNIPIHQGFVTPDEIRDYDGDDNLYVSCPMDRSFVEDGVTAKIPLSNFGNAESKHVVEGKVFTSKEGYYAKGTARIYDGEHLIAERNENVDSDTGFGFYVYPGYNDYFVQDEVYLEVPKSALGNASPISVSSNVTFTSENGVKIQGALKYLSADDLESASYVDEDDSHFEFETETIQAGILQGRIFFKIPKSNFGFVTPDLVPKGYTFTSMHGFDIGGTMPNVGFTGYERTVHLDEDDPTGNTFYVKVSQNYTEGYLERAGKFIAEVYPKLEIDGNKVTMECLGAKIERTVGLTVDTCTFNVTFTKNTGNTLISATTFANGAISVFNSHSNSGTVTIANVVCGSALSINTAAMCSLYWSGSKEDHYSLYGGTITVPTAPGTYTVEVGEIDD